VVDTLRADSIEPYTNLAAETPAILTLARDGVVFDNVYASSSWTRPSIASLLTGLAPDVHGVETRRDDAAQSLEMLAEHFQRAGYRTGAVITNPNVGRYFGFNQGYDDFIELYDHEGRGPVEATTPQARSDVVTRRAIDWIEDVDGPFFLFVLTTDPHWPYSPPESFDRYRIAVPERGNLGETEWKFLLDMASAQGRYYGEIASNDASFGELLEHLRSRGIYENTCIVFTSDHGEHFGEHWERFHGNSLYQESLRIPLILKRPNEEEAGRRVQTPVQLLDVFPTLLRSAGLEVPQGLEATALPLEEASAGRSIYARIELDGFSGEALMEFPWKLISPDTPRAGVHRFGGGLFEIEDDPGEFADRSDMEPDRVASMRERLRRRAVTNSPKAAAYRKNAERPAKTELPAAERAALEALGYLGAEEQEPVD
jgi:arylsulfatase A-like enzyme